VDHYACDRECPSGLFQRSRLPSVVAVIVKPESISDLPLVERLYSQLGFSTGAQFIIGFAVALLLITALKNLATRWIAMKRRHMLLGISEICHHAGLYGISK
jgi:hypothetical protein